MEFKGTPWTMEYDNSDDRSGGQWYYVGPVRISFRYGLSDDELKEVNDAARVMTVAPELLKELKSILDWLDDGNRVLSDACVDDVNRARAVIRKATE